MTYTSYRDSDKETMIKFAVDDYVQVRLIDPEFTTKVYYLAKVSCVVFYEQENKEVVYLNHGHSVEVENGLLNNIVTIVSNGSVTTGFTPCISTVLLNSKQVNVSIKLQFRPTTTKIS